MFVQYILFTVFMFRIDVAFALVQNQRPNIVIFMADDLGWMDVGYHGSEFQTPNIDAFAYDGIILNKFLSQPLCTPSRAALLTAEYPIRTGMQYWVIDGDEPWGLPLNRTIFPQHLKKAGYETYLVGKWHLGFYRRAYTPRERGFDHHYGYWGPYVDYWTKTFFKLNRPYNRGRDLRRDFVNDPDNTTYATDLFTKAACEYISSHNETTPMFLMVNHLAPHTGNQDDPMQAPKDSINKFLYIPSEKRRIDAAMVSALDTSFGEVVKALSLKNMLNNTILLFMSDNGAPCKGLHSNEGSNYPLRSQKGTNFQGGIQVPAFIWSSLLPDSGRVSDVLMHITDVFPTLLRGAGVSFQPTQPIDGIDQWSALSLNLPGKRNEVVVNINPVDREWAIIKNNWKLLNGTTLNGTFDGWLSDPPMETDQNIYVKRVLESTAAKVLGSNRLSGKVILKRKALAKLSCPPRPPASSFFECDLTKEKCLFNLAMDPCEQYNFAKLFPQKVLELESVYEYYRKQMVPSLRKLTDPCCDPAYYDNIWTYWGDLNKCNSTNVQ